MPANRQTTNATGLGLTILLCLGVIAFYDNVYRPTVERRLQLENEAQTIERRVHRLQTRISRLQWHCDELENNVPEATRDAIRDVLKQGEANAYQVPTAAIGPDGKAFASRRNNEEGPIE